MGLQFAKSTFMLFFAFLPRHAFSCFDTPDCEANKELLEVPFTILISLSVESLLSLVLLASVMITCKCLKKEARSFGLTNEKLGCGSSLPHDNISSACSSLLKQHTHTYTQTHPHRRIWFTRSSISKSSSHHDSSYSSLVPFSHPPNFSPLTRSRVMLVIIMMIVILVLFPLLSIPPPASS